MWILIAQNSHLQFLQMKFERFAFANMPILTKIKKANQSYTTIYLDLEILYYNMVGTIYQVPPVTKPPMTPSLRLYYIMEEYTVDCAELMLEYITSVCNMSRNLPWSYSNLLTHDFQASHVPLEDDEHLDSHHQWAHSQTVSYTHLTLPTKRIV